MDITQLTDFITNHPWLVGTLLIALIALIVIEVRNKSKFAIDTQKLIQYINHDRAVIWDIRSRKDFDQGHITAAKNTLSDQLDQAIKKHKNKTHPIILVCNNGMHSAGHLKKLHTFYDKLFYLNGGITEWQNQQLPLVKS